MINSAPIKITILSILCLIPIWGWAQNGTTTTRALETDTTYQAYKNAVAVPEKLMKAISSDYRDAPEEKKKDDNFRKGLDDRYAKAAAMKENAQYQYIKGHPNSIYSLQALKEIVSKTINLQKADSAFRKLPATAQNSASGQEIAAQINIARTTAIGAFAPDFTLPDPDGKPVRLSDFKGKYVLLDFWASWCGPCRAENPNLVRVYRTFKDQNFSILGVSLDQPGKKEAWLEAIKSDSITWPQVSDLQFWNNAAAKKYNVKFLPQNLLIDPNGKIIAKNLKGEDLYKKIAEVTALK